MGEQPPYVLSVGFRRKARATTVYRRVEALLYDQPVDLSAYNVELAGRPLVIVLGHPPPAEVHAALTGLLGGGRPVVVPEPVLATLYRRSLGAWAQAPWSELHHRPGRVLRVEEG